jgi:hypothetical protein
LVVAAGKPITSTGAASSLIAAEQCVLSRVTIEARETHSVCSCILGADATARSSRMYCDAVAGLAKAQPIWVLVW